MQAHAHTVTLLTVAADDKLVLKHPLRAKALPKSSEYLALFKFRCRTQAVIVAGLCCCCRESTHCYRLRRSPF